MDFFELKLIEKIGNVFAYAMRGKNMTGISLSKCGVPPIPVKLYLILTKRYVRRRDHIFGIPLKRNVLIIYRRNYTQTQ